MKMTFPGEPSGPRGPSLLFNKIPSPPARPPGPAPRARGGGFVEKQKGDPGGPLAPPGEVISIRKYPVTGPGPVQGPAQDPIHGPREPGPGPKGRGLGPKAQGPGQDTGPGPRARGTGARGPRPGPEVRGPGPGPRGPGPNPRPKAEGDGAEKRGNAGENGFPDATPNPRLSPSLALPSPFPT